MKIAVIIGSSRPNRISSGVAQWVLSHVQKNKADYELIDLADWNMPMYNEPATPKTRQYEGKHTIAWSKKIAEADGFVIVTPEYNHSIPAVLKNALDYLYYEWNKKPVAFVSYGSVGGARAVEHLRGIVAELQMVSIAPTVHLVGYFGGEIAAEYSEKLRDVENELLWWANVLHKPRQLISESVK